MKRIGILLSSTTCSEHLYETIDTLTKDCNVELFFLLNRSDGVQESFFDRIKFKISKKDILKAIDLIFFKIFTGIEYKFFSAFSQKIKNYSKRYCLDGFIKNEIVSLIPIFSESRLVVRYSNEDITKIKMLNLDLIVRGNTIDILKGDILNSTKDGIMSLYHSDNRWNNSSIIAFWEVYLRKDSTGFTIQILKDELGYGNVIFRGDIATKRSYIENVVNLCRVSNSYFIAILLQYVKTNQLPEPEERIIHETSFFSRPSVSQTILYAMNTLVLFFSIAINRLFLHKQWRWGVAFTDNSWRNAILRNGIRVKNPSGRFFADPFVITRDKRTICYVEDYCYKSKKGSITAIEIIGKKEYKVLGYAIEENFHMSFPFLFEYEEELYMTPETNDANSIRLYKCIEFPLKWEYQKNILSNVSAADSMIINYDKRWWLFSNIAIDEDNDHESSLMIFYSDNPLSDTWVAHDLNPLIIDSKIARNGGVLDYNSGGEVIRSRQKQAFNFYGKSLTLAKITNLTPYSFHEEEIAQIYPDFFECIEGCHHIHSNEEYTVYDYIMRESL